MPWMPNFPPTCPDSSKPTLLKKSVSLGRQTFSLFDVSFIALQAVNETLPNEALKAHFPLES